MKLCKSFFKYSAQIFTLQPGIRIACLDNFCRIKEMRRSFYPIVNYKVIISLNSFITLIIAVTFDITALKLRFQNN
jgi:hypothetical protein